MARSEACQNLAVLTTERASHVRPKDARNSDIPAHCGLRKYTKFLEAARYVGLSSQPLMPPLDAI
jgi:hypothetical protein